MTDPSHPPAGKPPFDKTTPSTDTEATRTKPPMQKETRTDKTTTAEKSTQRGFEKEEGGSGSQVETEKKG